ncbi:hypothetical protein RB195_019905 [Necator americanus]
MAFTYCAALDCYSGAKDRNDRWVDNILSIKECNQGEICSVQVITKRNEEVTYELGCTASQGFVGHVGCGNILSKEYTKATICVCNYNMCNLDLLIGRNPESVEYLKLVLPFSTWLPTGSVEDC